MRLDHADARHVHVEDLRQHQVHVVRHLGRGVHRHAVALGVVVGDRGVHLHLVLADLGAVVGAVAHEVGLREAVRDAAELEQHVALDVAGLLGVQLHGVGRERIARGVVGRQLAHLQPDQLDRPLGGRVVDRRDRRDRLAAIAHLVARQRMLAARDRQHAEGLVAVGAGDDRLHARQLRSLRDVDLDDLAVRIRAAEDAARQHARLQNVGGVLGAARHLLRSVDHRHIAADVVRRHDVVHETRSFMAHTAQLLHPPPGGGTVPAAIAHAQSWRITAAHLARAARRRTAPPR